MERTRNTAPLKIDVGFKMKIFDPDGEVIKKTMPVGELEHLCEIGGGFDQTSVTLSLYSERLDRRHVTDLLDVTPTKAWDPGERHPFGNKGNTRTCEWGKWYLSTDLDTRPIEEKIREILDQCSPDLDHWKQLSSDYDMWLEVCGHLNNFNRELNLSVELLCMLTVRNLDLKVDVYFDGDNEEENPTIG